MLGMALTLLALGAAAPTLLDETGYPLKPIERAAIE